MTHNSVVVSNGFGRFHVYRAAQAAASVNLLQCFITSFCIKNNLQLRILDNAVTKVLFGEGLIKKGTLRQYSPEIPSTYIKSLMLPELYFRIGSALRGLHIRPSASAMQLHANMSVPYTRDCRIFHTRSGFGLRALEQARKNGAVCLVDHSIAAPSFRMRLDNKFYEKFGREHTNVRPHDSAMWSLVAQDIRNADIIIANSEFVRRTLVDEAYAPSEKIIVLPMGVNTQVFSPDLSMEKSRNPVIILYVGTISLRKGVHILLEAYKRLNLPSSKLILVGKTGDASGLIDPQDETVQYVSHLPHPELVDLYRSASLFVFPSLLEGSALVTYEAMASGLPIITTPEAGSVAREGQDGFIIPSNDVEALMDRITFLYLNQDIARKMGADARQNIIENYTWEHYAARIIDLYQAVLERV